MTHLGIITADRHFPRFPVGNDDPNRKLIVLKRDKGIFNSNVPPARRKFIARESGTHEVATC